MNPSPTPLFDSHAHFFTNDFERYPIDIAGAREGEAELRKRVEDEPSTDTFMLGMWDAHGVVGGTAVQYNQVYKTDNRYTIDVADRHPDRITAVLLVAAAKPETPRWLRETAAAHNVSGIRLFGFPDGGEFPWLDSPAALDTWDAAAELGLAVDLMFVPGGVADQALPRIGRLAERYPNVPVVLDHCGWPIPGEDPQAAFGEAHRALTALPNVFFKYTQVNARRLVPHGMDMARFLRAVVDLMGPERTMWGSDYGNTPATYPQIVESALAATVHLNEDERAAVLHNTGRRIFGTAPQRR